MATKEEPLITEWRQNVLNELKYCRENIDGVKEDISDLKVDVSQLKAQFQNADKQMNAHPSGCPLNRKGVEDIIDQKLIIYESQLPGKHRKAWGEIISLVAMAIAIITYIMSIKP